MTEYPPPPNWLAAVSQPEDPSGEAVGAEPPGSPHEEAPGTGSSGGAGSSPPSRRLRCVARNKSGTTRANRGLRCARTAVAGDPDYLCRNHRQQLLDGQTVYTVDAWINGKDVQGKVLQPAERVPSNEVEITPSQRGKSRSLPLRLSLGPEDIARLNTAEGRQDLELAAVGYVASLILDEYAPPRERLQAARMVLPPRQLTAEEMQQERDLDDELFELIEVMAQEAEDEQPSDDDVIKLLSPDTRTRVLTELADHGIRWVDEKEAV